MAKTVDFIFRTYYSRKLGAEGMGIFSLVFSVHGIMLTFATCGLGTAVSKTVADRYSAGDYVGIKKTVRMSITAVCVLSAAVIAFVCAFSDKIASDLLNEPRCARSLVLLSPSILFMGISYCIKGYFYAMRKIIRPASSEFLEQAVKIGVIAFLLSRLLPYGIDRGCEAVFLGLSIGEFASCFYLCVLYAEDACRIKIRERGGALRIGAELAEIALPSTVSSLAGSFLRSQEDVWTVSCLCRFGMSRREALSGYGEVHGMVMPLIVFPLTLISSFLTLLVPEISRADKLKSRVRLKTLVLRIYRFCAFLGFMVFTVYMTFAEELAGYAYHAPQLSVYIRRLAPLFPLMFSDSISCGILNGLGKQASLLKYSLADSSLRLVLILLLVPIFGLKALIFIIICSNIFTCFLTGHRVSASAKIGTDIVFCFIRPALSAAASTIILRACFENILSVGSYPALIFGIAVAAAVYSAVGTLLGAASKDDIVWLIRRVAA